MSYYDGMTYNRQDYINGLNVKFMKRIFVKSSLSIPVTTTLSNFRLVANYVEKKKLLYA